MARTAPFRRSLRQELRDPEFALEYAAELQRLRIGHQIATARRAAGLSQQDLAQRMGTAQPTVARLERGDYRGYTMTTLIKAAHALRRELRIAFSPAPRRRLLHAKKAVGRGAKNR